MFAFKNPRYFVYKGPARSINYTNSRGTIVSHDSCCVSYSMRDHTSAISIYKDCTVISLNYNNEELLLVVSERAPDVSDPNKFSFSFNGDIDLKIELPIYCQFRCQEPQILLDPSRKRYISYYLEEECIKLYVEFYTGSLELILSPDDVHAALAKLNLLVSCN